MKTYAKYRIAHEGSSFGTVVGLGKMRKDWGPDAIEQLNAKISSCTFPVLIYKGHPVSGQGRVMVGHVLESTVIKENNQKTVVVIAEMFTDPSRLDVISIEAELGMESDEGGVWQVVEVEKVDSLAVGDSRNADPGFPDARLISSWESKSELPWSVTTKAPAIINGGPCQERSKNMKSTIILARPDSHVKPLSEKILKT